MLNVSHNIISLRDVRFLAGRSLPLHVAKRNVAFRDAVGHGEPLELHIDDIDDTKVGAV